MSIDGQKLYLRALAAARTEAVKTGITPTGPRLHRIYAEAAAPEGGWKSKILATRKPYLDAIEKRLRDRKMKYVRARDQIYTMISQKDLDQMAELTHFEIRKTSKGHIGWKVIHPEGLHEYFLVGDDLHRAPHHHAVDTDTHQRVSPSHLTTGLARSMQVLREHDIEIPADLAKKERKTLEDNVWKITHKDYRSTIGNKRHVLTLHKGATTFVPLGSLALEDLRKKAAL